MSVPVTVSVTRHVDPAHEDQMLAWLRAGSELAERFDGFLGSGWVRPALIAAKATALLQAEDAAAALAARAKTALADLASSAARLHAEDQAGGPLLPANR